MTYHLHIILLATASVVDITHSFAQQPSISKIIPAASSAAHHQLSISSLSAYRDKAQQDSNWEDDTKSSRVNPSVTDYVPPWRDHQGQQESLRLYCYMIICVSDMTSRLFGFIQFIYCSCKHMH